MSLPKALPEMNV